MENLITVRVVTEETVFVTREADVTPEQLKQLQEDEADIFDFDYEETEREYEGADTIQIEVKE